jgi:hypothetical protein
VTTRGANCPLKDSKGIRLVSLKNIPITTLMPITRRMLTTPTNDNYVEAECPPNI